MRRKGETVYDKVTRTVTTIVRVQIERDEEDGRKVANYLLADNVPLIPGYDRWRWYGEVCAPSQAHKAENWPR